MANAGTFVVESAPQGNVLAGEPNAGGEEDTDSSNGNDVGSSGQDIVVTGTNIRGANATSPITVISQQDIDRSGYIDISELAASIPQNFGGGASQTVNGGFTRGGSQYNQGLGTAFNLRGLGPGSTLTLLNGRRVAPAGRGTFVDITAIPLSIIKRIDVLTDGASAIYGSDAIGGVVNIITDDRYEGAETRVQAGTVTSGGRQEYALSQTFGKSWETGNITAALDNTRQTPLLGRDRDFNSTGRSDDDYLLPKQNEVSAFAAARQELASDVDVGADALFSTRHFERNDGTVPSFFTSGRQKSFALSAFMKAALSPGWDARAGFDYSRSALRSTTVFSGGGEASPSDHYDNLAGDLVVNGRVLPLPGGDIRVAIGGSYRRERSHFDSPPTVQDDSRKVASLFGELNVPIVSERNQVPGFYRLTAQVAGRYDHYSDFESTFNPKFGVNWLPVERLSLRASYSESFRAPFFYELQGGNSAFLFDFPDPKSERADGLTTAIVYLGTNPDLKPETAKTFSTGIDWSPSIGESTRISLNYFNIHYRGKITDLSTDALFQFLPREDIYGAYVSRNPSDQTITNLIQSLPLGITDFNQFIFNRTDIANLLTEYQFGAICDCRIQNAAALKVAGFDLQLASEFALGRGKLDLTFQGTLYTKYDRSVTADAPSAALLDTVFNPIDFRARTGAFWSDDHVTVGGFINYSDSYDDPGDGLYTAGGKLRSWTTVDLQAGYDFGKGRQNLLGGSRVALSINNLFDTDPPHLHATPLQLGYDPENASPRGRFVALSLSKQW
jgi:outer membrane receptor protein involved in Fe transport